MEINLNHRKRRKIEISYMNNTTEMNHTMYIHTHTYTHTQKKKTKKLTAIISEVESLR